MDKQIILNKKISNSIIIFSLAFLVRLVYIAIFYYPDIAKSFSDDLAYMNMTQNIIEQGFWLTNLESLGSYSGAVGPGIGWILLPVVAVFGANWLAVFIYVAIGSALISVLIYKIALFLYNKRIALFASIYSIFFISFMKYTISSGKDIWMTLLFLFTIYLIIRLDEKSKRFVLYTVLSAFIYTVLFHLDERFLILSPVLFLFLTIKNLKPLKLEIKKPLIFTLFVLLLTLPWTLRNYKVYKRVLFVSVRTAPLTENLIGYEPKEYLSSNKDRWYISETKIDSISKGLIPERELLMDMDKQQINAIKMGITPKPYNYWQIVWASFINFWEPVDFKYSYYHDGYRFDGKWSFKHNISTGLTYGIVLIFSIIGLFYLFNKNRRINYLLIFLTLTYFFIHLFLIPFTKYRYRLPIEPIVIIYGCYGIFIMFNLLKFHLYNNRKIKNIE